MGFSTTLELIHDLAQGKMIILLDDKNRENEGDLVLAAEFITPEKINFLMSEARGMICLTLTSEKTKQLELPLMLSESQNKLLHKTAFTISIDAAEGMRSGVSATDRAHTIKTAVQKNAKASDLVSPGHVFPIQAADGGVLVRAGHTEGSVDLVRLAGCAPSAVICEVLNKKGEAATGEELIQFSQEYGIKIGTIEDLIAYRKQKEN